MMILKNVSGEMGGIGRDLEASRAAMLLTEEIDRLLCKVERCGLQAIAEGLRNAVSTIPAIVALGRSGGSGEGIFSRATTSRVELAQLEAQLMMSDILGQLSRKRLGALLGLINHIKSYCSIDAGALGEILPMKGLPS
jgi:hypothetical protein